MRHVSHSQLIRYNWLTRVTQPADSVYLTRVAQAALAPLHRGVYFGFARLPEDPKHAAWCKCVVNVGQRPTFADGDGVTVEVRQGVGYRV